MILIRHAQQEDVSRLKEIWQLCFGDESSYIDHFYENEFKEDQTLLLLYDDEIAAMLTIIPVTISTSDRQSTPAGMLYAIATHPDYQKKGYAGRLINCANDLLSANQIPYSLLVPANRGLFGFYDRMGYRRRFFICESILTRRQISELPDVCSERGELNAADPEKYNAIRNKILNDNLHVQYKTHEVGYQKKLSQREDADIFIYKNESDIGCIAVERISRRKVFFKEFLINKKMFNSAIKEVAAMFEAEKYIVRLPSYFSELAKNHHRPFAMLKPTGTFSNIEVKPEDKGYLGLAFD